MNIGIDHISFSFPSGQAETNDELVSAHGFDPGFISEKLGIDLRLKLAREETVSELCANAVRQLLEETRLNLERVECIGVVTQTPDYCLPHTSALVHGQIGLSKKCAAFDIGLGCSGYVYGLSIMRGLMLAEGLSCGVLATVDAYSKIMDPKDKATAPLLGMQRRLHYYELTELRVWEGQSLAQMERITKLSLLGALDLVLRHLSHYLWMAAPFLIL